MICSKKRLTIVRTQKIDKRILKSKSNIRNALLSLMRQQNIGDITITELCKLAHVNRKTFYTYYGTVYDVVSEYEDTIINSLCKEVFDLDNKNAEPSTIIFTFQHKLQENVDFLTYLYDEDHIFPFEKKLIRRLSISAFERYKKKRKATDKKIKEAKLALNYIVSGIVSMQITWFFSESTVSFSSLAEISQKFIKANVAILLES